MNRQNELNGNIVVDDFASGIRAPSAADAQSSKLVISSEAVAAGEAIRDEVGWGRNYYPPIKRRESEPKFRRICDGVLDELQEIDQYLDNERVTEEGAGCIAEIKALVQQLYECEWGEDDCLKNIAVGIQFQINNVEFTECHIRFLKEIMLLLRARYLIDDALVEMCYDLIEEHGLDNFRGTITEPIVAKSFKIVEVQPVNED